MDTSAPRPGFFGKVPTRGDFVSRGMAPDFRANLDRWLSASIEASRRLMGQSWLPAYLCAPMWRFILGSGLVGNHPTIGVMMPSVDRVGRYFPLILAMELPDCRTPAHLFHSGNSWFEAVETLLLTSLENDFDLDAFDRQLGHLDLPAYELRNSAPPGLARIALGKGEQLTETFAHMFDEMTALGDGRYSMWWTLGSDAVKPSVLIGRDLPAPSAFAALLDGCWGNWGVRVTAAEDRLDNLPVDVPGPAGSFRSAASTHPGTRASVNEDAELRRDDLGLWVVADGVGGHQAGQQASQLVVNTLDRLHPPLSFSDGLAEIHELLEEANNILVAHAAQIDSDAIVASTVVALLIHGSRYGIVWSGDSRAYLIRDQVMYGLTRDHVDGPQSRQLTKAVGAAREFGVERVVGSILPGDRFLLCSDGLVKCVREGDILLNGRSGSVQAAAAALLDNALIANAQDNVTIVLVDVPDHVPNAAGGSNDRQ